MNQKKFDRQSRAATRLQEPSSTLIVPGWSAERIEQMLRTKLQEFQALCAAKVISASNVKGAAMNVLVGAAKTLKPEQHRFWLSEFTETGLHAATKSAAARM